MCNGSVENLASAEEALRVTGCDAVMSSEALLEDPRLFKGGCLSAQDVLDTAREYLVIAKETAQEGHNGEESVNGVRPHMFKQLHRFLSVHTEVRDWLQVSQAEQVFEVVDRIEDSIRKHGLDMRGGQYLEDFQSSPNWYHRHRRKREVAASRAATAAEEYSDGSGLGRALK
jgi:tRNA-dihydrouridine synthase